MEIRSFSTIKIRKSGRAVSAAPRFTAFSATIRNQSGGHGRLQIGDVARRLLAAGGS
jgi:hypothetical protein